MSTDRELLELAARAGGLEKAITEVDGETIKAGVKYRIDDGKFVSA